ncbi:MAG: SDR family oxidoreductase [Desulfobacterales bacterium]|nr:MAG: SDR family oxidoreductase [Desulfobacterales bacterium]
MENTLSGKTAIITGASRGIGKTIAIALGREKMQLALMARSANKLQDVVDEIHAVGGEAIAVPCDLMNTDAIEASMKRIFQHFNSLDVLISNAGIFLEKPITEIKIEEWERVLKTNLTATFLLCQAVFLKMKDQKGGRIITIGSSASNQGYIHQAAYCASKHGLLGFARCLSIEAKPHNVHVHTICPGGVRTDLIKDTYVGQRVSQGALIEPENIAELVVFLIRQPENVDIPEINLKRFAV